MTLFYRLLVFAIASVWAYPVSAIDDSLYVHNPRVVSFNTHYGMILPHSEVLRDISNSKPWGFQLEYSRHLNTQSAWDYFGSYPKVGFSFAYFNYDNPTVLGNSYNLNAFFEPYITYHNRINPSFRLGFGISYLDNTYHSSHNPFNKFYSSPLSFFIQFKGGLNFTINEEFDFALSANFSHISNGSIKKPNKGINFPTLSMGLDYKLDKVHFERRTRQLTKHDIHGRLWRVNANFYTSFKQIDVDSKKYQVYGIELTGGKIINRVSSLNAGLEFSYDHSMVQRNRNDVDGQSKHTANILSGIFVHELLMGRFIFDQAIGLYINSRYLNSFPYYQKIGLRYRLDKSLNVGLSIKAHNISAEYLSFKIGLSL